MKIATKADFAVSVPHVQFKTPNQICPARGDNDATIIVTNCEHFDQQYWQERDLVQVVSLQTIALWQMKHSRDQQCSILHVPAGKRIPALKWTGFWGLQNPDPCVSMSGPACYGGSKGS